MRSIYNLPLTTYSFLKLSVFIVILTLNFNQQLSAQIVFTRDTTLTGDHTFNQQVMVIDTNVTVVFDNATIFFYGGMTVESGTLIIHGGFLTFYNGTGLSLSRGAYLIADTQAEFEGVNGASHLTLLDCLANITGCKLSNMRIITSGRPAWLAPNSYPYKFINCEMDLLTNNSNAIFNGSNFLIQNCEFTRIDTVGITMGLYPNIVMGGQMGKVENCMIGRGGIDAPWNTNQNLEIINNTISNTEVGIRFWGVSKIRNNRIQTVEIGIEGGTTGEPLNNVLIENNSILYVSEQAIKLRGDSLTIHKNIITGNGETGKGILFNGSSGSITNNLISDFKISEAANDVDGIALYIKNTAPGQNRTIDVSGNIFEYCGLSDVADPEIVSSIVHLESPVVFTGNEFRLNTLGGMAGPTHNFPGGPVLNIVVTEYMDPPVIVNNNFIHSNTFVNSGVYEPTQTKGTLVAATLQRRKLEFKGNMLYGSPDATLGMALFPYWFDGGIVGDSLVFEENTVMNNLVGLGTMAAPNLSNYNNFKENTNYHILRYWAQMDPEMFAQNNNWDSEDQAVIDNMLYDDDEDPGIGPINFGGFFNINYNVNPTNPGLQQLNQGDSLGITIRVTDPQGNPVSNMPGFFTSSDANVARVMMDDHYTGNDGYLNGTLHSYNDGSTNITVYAGGSVSDPIQVNVGLVGVDNELTDVSAGDFKLFQNYPNPFNPATLIQYKVGERQFITLKIYDVLGNKISTLVNEEKPAGNYQIEFNGSNLSSGVYFYSIQAGDFTDTKKLILIK